MGEEAIRTGAVSYVPCGHGDFDYVVLKRTLDVVGSAIGLALLWPVMGLIGGVILVRSGRPAIIRQTRVGRRGRLFTLFKFRTLPRDALVESDRCWASEAADAWGRFLRATGLDELPQLWNVLQGEMSLVGPRPERPHFAERFGREMPRYPARHALQVGITGWAQVHGWRGDTSIARRVEHDLYYLENWSFALDLRILWATALNLGRQIGRCIHAGSL